MHHPNLNKDLKYCSLYFEILRDIFLISLAQHFVFIMYIFCNVKAGLQIYIYPFSFHLIS